MLTKEECNNLLQDINSRDKSDQPHEYTISAFYLNNILLKYTEKPKPKTQVGDIYKNESGLILKIVSIDNDPRWEFITNDVYHYNEKGFHLAGLTRGNLDLSKVYKLVEITDD